MDDHPAAGVFAVEIGEVVTGKLELLDAFLNECVAEICGSGFGGNRSLNGCSRLGDCWDSRDFLVLAKERECQQRDENESKRSHVRTGLQDLVKMICVH